MGLWPRMGRGSDQKSVRSLSFCQWGCRRTRLTLSMSMVLLPDRTTKSGQIISTDGTIQIH